MTPRDFKAGVAVRALNPDVPEIGGFGPGQTVTPRTIIRSSPAAEQEDELREEVRKEIVSRGWALFCGTTAARSRRTVGEPDLIVCADRGRVFFVELKRRDGKTSPAQNAVHAHLKRLGHNVSVVRSLDEFRAVVDGKDRA